MAEDHHRIIKGLVFRLVRKHVAGTTTMSVIKAAAALSGKGLLPTVTFLNDHVNTQLNARYNINAYAELARQLSRLNVKADISVRMSQLGHFLSKEGAASGIREILDAMGDNLGRLWLESEAGVSVEEQMKLCEQKPGPHLGFEMPVALLAGGSPKRYMSTRCSNVKLTTYSPVFSASVSGSGAGKHSKRYKDMLGVFTDAVGRLAEKDRTISIASQDEKFMLRLAKELKEHRRHLIFEVPLGYNVKRVGMLLKQKANVGVYVSYGKDWVPYAINRLTEGRIRDIAIAVLNGEHKVVENAE